MGFLRSFRRQMQRMEASNGKHRKMHFEPLEPRILLSAETLSFSAAAGAAIDLTLRLDDPTQELQLIDNTDQSVVQSRALAETSAVVITGADQDDTLNIDFSTPFSVPDGILFSDDFTGDGDRLLVRGKPSFWNITGNNAGNVDGAGFLEFSGIENLDGGAGEDTLYGPSADTTWSITGENAGSVSGVNFSGMENLTGAADNEDTFVFEAGGSLSGLIDGGAGGFDSLVIDFNAGSVVYDAAGPHSGTVTADGNTIAFTGLEPVTLTPPGSSAVADLTVEVTGTDSDDLVLELDPDDATGSTLRLASTSGTIESPSFAFPTNTLRILMGEGNDTLTIGDVGSFDLSKLTVVGGGDPEDTIVVERNINMVLTDTSLQLGTEAITLDGIEIADLTGGDNDNTFTVSGWSGIASLAGLEGKDTYAFGDNWGNVTIEGATDAGIDTLDFTALTGDLNLFVSDTTTARDTITRGPDTIKQTGAPAEEIDATLTLADRTALNTALDDLLGFVRQMKDAGGDLQAIANQLPLLDRAREAGLADVAALTEAFEKFVPDAKAKTSGKTTLSDVVDALNSLSQQWSTETLPAPLAGLTLAVSTNYRGEDPDVVDGAAGRLELLLDFDLEATAAETFEIDLGEKAENIGVGIDAQVTATGTLEADFTIGLSTAATPTGFLLPSEGDQRIRLAVDATATLAPSTPIELNFLELTGTGALILGGRLDLTLADEDGVLDARIAPDAVITDVVSLGAPAPTLPSGEYFGSTVSVAVSSGVEVDGTDLGALPDGDVTFSLSISGDPFGDDTTGAIQPAVEVKAKTEIDPELDLLDFSNISPSEILGMLSEVGDLLGSISGSEFLATPIPFTDLTLGDVLDFGQGFKQAVIDPLFKSGDSLKPDNNGDGAVDTKDLNFSSIQQLGKHLAETLGLDLGSGGGSTSNLSFIPQYISGADVSVREKTADDTTVQLVTVQNAAGGTFKLRLLNAATDAMTAAIAFDAAAEDGDASVKTLLNEAFGSGTVTSVSVSPKGTSSRVYEITFASDPGTLLLELIKDGGAATLVSAGNRELSLRIEYTPSFGFGEARVGTELAGGDGINEKQTVTINAVESPPGDGLEDVFQLGLRLDPNSPLLFTSDIAWNAEANVVESAIERLGVTLTDLSTQTNTQRLTLRNTGGGDFTISQGASETDPIGFDVDVIELNQALFNKGISATATADGDAFVLTPAGGAVALSLGSIRSLRSGDLPASPVDVSVTKDGKVYTVLFDKGVLLGTDVPQMVSDSSELLGELSLDFGTSLGDLASLTTEGGFRAFANLTTGITFGLNLNPSQELTIAPVVFAPGPAIEVRTTTEGDGKTGEVQTITIRNTNAGTFALTLPGGSGTSTTGSIDFTSASELQTKLNELTDFSTKNVTVNDKTTSDGTGTYVYEVEFKPGSGDVPELKPITSLLKGAADNGRLAGTNPATFTVELFNRAFELAGGGVVRNIAEESLQSFLISVPKDMTDNNTSLSDLRDDVAHQINDALKAFALGFFDAITGELSTGAIEIDGSASADVAPLTELRNDLEFTLEITQLMDSGTYDPNRSPDDPDTPTTLYKSGGFSNVEVGDQVWNTADGSRTTVEEVGEKTITIGALQDGTVNEWKDTDNYEIRRPTEVTGRLRAVDMLDQSSDVSVAGVGGQFGVQTVTIADGATGSFVLGLGALLSRDIAVDAPVDRPSAIVTGTNSSQQLIIEGAEDGTFDLKLGTKSAVGIAFDVDADELELKLERAFGVDVSAVERTESGDTVTYTIDFATDPGALLMVDNDSNLRGSSIEEALAGFDIQSVSDTTPSGSAGRQVTIIFNSTPDELLRSGNGTLLDSNGALDPAEAERNDLKAADYLAPLQRAIDSALERLNRDGENAALEGEVFLDYAVKVEDVNGKLKLTVSKVADVEKGADTTAGTLEMRFRSPVQVDAGGGKITLSTSPVRYSTVALEPATRIERRIEISTDYNDPAYQQLGLLTAPTPFNGRIDDDITFDLTVNDKKVEVTLEKLTTEDNESIDDGIDDEGQDPGETAKELIHDLQDAVNIGLQKAGFEAGIIKVKRADAENEGNRIAFVGTEGKVKTISIFVPDPLSGGGPNGAITELGFAAGQGDTKRGKSTEFFVEDAIFTGSFSLTAEDVSATATFGFLGIKAEGSGTIGDATVTVAGDGGTTKQTVTVKDAIGGTFRLSLGSDRTDAIAYDAEVDKLKAALNDALGAGTVTNVSGAKGGPYTIEFASDPGELFEADNANLDADGDDKIVRGDITLALKNPEDGGSRLTPGDIVGALRDGRIFFDGGDLAAAGSTGVLDGGIGAELGFDLAIAPDGFLSGLADDLNASIEIGVGSPNWLAARPSLSDPLGFGDAKDKDGVDVDGPIEFTGASDKFSLGEKAPENGELHKTLSFVISNDAGKTALGVLNKDDTKAKASVSTTQKAKNGNNEIQVIRVANASDGTFKITYNGKTSTKALLHNDTVASMEAALGQVGFDVVDEDGGAEDNKDVKVTVDTEKGSGDRLFKIEFVGTLAGTNVDSLGIAGDELTRTRADLQTDLQAAIDGALVDLGGTALKGKITVSIDVTDGMIQLAGEKDYSIRGNTIQVEFTGPDFDGLLSKFKDLSFRDIIAGLEKAIEFLQSLDGSDGNPAKVPELNATLPLINRSVSDLLDPAADFLDFVDEIAADPAGSVQQLNVVIADVLGFAAPAASVAGSQTMQTVQLDNVSAGTFSLIFGSEETAQIELVSDNLGALDTAELELTVEDELETLGADVTKVTVSETASSDLLSSNVRIKIEFASDPGQLTVDGARLIALDILSLNLENPDNPVLDIDFGFGVGVQLSRPFDLDLADAITALGLPDFLTSLVGFDAAGSLSVDAGIDLNLAFGLDFTGDDKAMFIRTDDTGVTARAEAAGTGLEFGARIGPLGLFVEEGEAGLNGLIDVRLVDADGDGRLVLLGISSGVDNDLDHLGDFFSTDGIDFELTGAAVLPLFIGTEGSSVALDFNDADGPGDDNIVVATFDAVEIFKDEDPNSSGIGIDFASITGKLTSTITPANLKAAIEGLGIGVGVSVDDPATIENGDKVFTVVFDQPVDALIATSAAGGLFVEVKTVNPDTEGKAATQKIVIKNNETGTFRVATPQPIPNFLAKPELPSLFVLLSDPAVVVDGLDRLLLTLQDALNGQIMGVELPFVGDLLADNPAANIIGDFRDDLLKPLANTIRENNLNLDGLIGLIKNTLFDVLGPSGPFEIFGGLLKDSDDSGDITVDDILVEFFDADGNPTGVFNAQSLQFDFDLGKNEIFTAPEIEFDLGIPAIGIEIDLQPEIEIDFNLHLGFGIDQNDGFYFVTDFKDQNGDPRDELDLDITVDFGSTQIDRKSANGRLIVLALTATDGVDIDGDGQLEFSNLFLKGGVDLRDPDGDGRLTFPEMTSGSLSDIFVAGISGGAELRLEAEVDFSTLDPSLANVLPSISTDILVDFSIDAAPGTGITVNPPEVAFLDVTLDLGSFISDFAGPVLESVGDVLGPLDFLIGPDGFLNKRIPLLSDLLGKTVTGKDLIVLYDPENGPKVVAFLDFVDELFFLTELVTDAAKQAKDGSIAINFGDVVLFDAPNGLDLAVGKGIVDEPFSFDLPNVSDLRDLRNLDEAEFLEATGASELPKAAGSKTSEFTKGVTKPGSINFPILKPENVFKLLMGQTATLVEIQLPEIGFEFFYRQVIPIYGPIIGTFSGKVGGGVQLGFGYDTLGLEQFLVTDNPANLINGFFLNDLDPETGFDRAEAFLNAEIAIGAGLSLGFITAGVEGGIAADIDFNLADLNADGKVRIDELAGNIVANDFIPLAIFDISGQFDLFLRAFFEINLGLFTISDSYEFARINLFSFDIPFERPSILAVQNGDTLTLNIGPNAEGRLQGDLRDIGEEIHVATKGDGSVYVWSSQFNVDKLVAQINPFVGVKKIVADGGAGNDVIDLSLVGGTYGIEVEVRGGEGNDILRGGDSDDMLYGDGGNDTLNGNGGVDELYGGEGNDTLYGGDNPEVPVVRVERVSGETKVQLVVVSGNGKYTLTSDGRTTDPISAGAMADDVLQTLLEAEIFEGEEIDPDNPDLGLKPVDPGDGVTDWTTDPTLPVGTYRVTFAEAPLRPLEAAGFGTDKLFGDEGDDSLDGGAGDDMLDGGPGDDTFKPSAGNDVISLANFGSIDRIDGDNIDDDDAIELDFSGKTENLVFFLQENAILIGFGEQLIDTATILASDIDTSGGTAYFAKQGIVTDPAGVAKIIGGDFADTFHVQGTAGAITLDGSMGNDAYLLYAGDGQLEATVDDRGNPWNSGDRIDVIGTTGADEITVTSSRIDLEAGGSRFVNYVPPPLDSNILQIRIYGDNNDPALGGEENVGGDDTIRVESAAAAVPVRVETGRGNDVVIIGDGTVDGIAGTQRPGLNAPFGLGPLVLVGGGGHDTVVIDDSVDDSANTGNVTAFLENRMGVDEPVEVGVVSGLDMTLLQDGVEKDGRVEFEGFEVIDVRMGTGNDIFTVGGGFNLDLAADDPARGTAEGRQLVDTEIPKVRLADPSDPDAEGIVEFVNSITGLTIISGGDEAVMSAANEKQIIDVVATDGSYTLTFTDPNGVERTTDLLAWNADAATIQQALIDLSNIGEGEVVVDQLAIDQQRFEIEFRLALGGRDVSKLVASPEDSVTVTETNGMGASGGGDVINVIATNDLDSDSFDRNDLDAQLGILETSTLTDGDAGADPTTIGDGTNEKQRLTIAAAARRAGETFGADVGYFTLQFRFQETRPISFNADADDIRDALAELSLIGDNVDVVDVSSGDDAAFEIIFVGSQAELNQGPITARIVPLAILGNAGLDRLNVQSIDQTTFFLGGADDDTVSLNVDVSSVSLDAPDLTAPPTALTSNGVNATITLDGELGNDAYDINLIGGTTDSLVNVFDSAAAVDGFDRLTVFGIDDADKGDLFLLRAGAAQSALAFVALLNEDGSKPAEEQPFERVNYDTRLEQIVVNSLGGNDEFFIDDTRAAITINGGDGDDFFQIGQLYKTARTSFEAGVAPGDEYATTKTTRGFLSNGISVPMTINGDAGEDEFIVFRNLAVLTLNGGDDNDSFLVQAFALEGSVEDERKRTDLTGDAGADLIQYAVNAPVQINGGDGLDTVIVIGTEFNDDFVVTDDGVFGGGLNVNFVNIELLEVDGAEGDDRFFILGTGENFVTRIVGSKGNDTFNVNGPTPENGVISNDLLGHSGIIEHFVNSSDADSLYQGLKADGISANVADNDEPAIVIDQSDGFSDAFDGSIDNYTVVLTRPPRDDKKVTITAVPAKGLVLLTQNPDNPIDPTDLVEVRRQSQNPSKPGDAIGLALQFDRSNWFIPQTVYFALDSKVLDFEPDFRLADIADIEHKIISDDVLTGTASEGSINSDEIPEEPGLPQKDEALLIDRTSQGQFAGPGDDGLDEGLRGAYVVITAAAPDADPSAPSPVGQTRLILGVVDENTLILDKAWDVVPANAQYQILRFGGVQVPNVRVTVTDPNAAAIIVQELGGDGFESAADTKVAEDAGSGGDDFIQVRLSKAVPDGESVTVALQSSLIGSTDVGVDGQLRFYNGAGDEITSLTFDDANPYHEFQIVRVVAFDDGIVEGFHNVDLKLAASGGDYDGIERILVTNIADDDAPGLRIIESDGSTDVIEFDPTLIEAIPLIDFEDSQTQTGNVFSGNTLTFTFDLSGVPEITGDAVLSVAAIADLNWFSETLSLNAEGVVAEDLFVSGGTQYGLSRTAVNITQQQLQTLVSNGDDGMGMVTFTITPSDEVTNFDAIYGRSNTLTLALTVRGERDATIEDATNQGFPAFDSYQVVLTEAPQDGETVTVTVDPRKTRTSRTGGIATFAEQVEVSLDGNEFVGPEEEPLELTFTVDDWFKPQTVYVRAYDDSKVDGGDTKVFAPMLDQVNRIQGPLFIIGDEGSDRTGLLEREPIMLPGEINQKESDGQVIAATEAVDDDPATVTIDTSAWATDEEMLKILGVDSVDEITAQTLIDKTIEIVSGPAKNKVRIISGAQLVADNVYLLTLNKKWESVFGAGDPSVPTEGDGYAITTTNPNFLGDPRENVDYLVVNDIDNINSFDDPELPEGTTNPFAEGRMFFDDSQTYGPLDETEAEHSALNRYRIIGFGMGGDRVIGGGADAELQAGGISYEELEIVEVNLGDGNNKLTVDSSIFRADGFQTWTIVNTGGGDDLVEVNLNEFEDGSFALNTQAGNDTVDASGSDLPLFIFGGDGEDNITGGDGDDIIFGDRGQVDFLNALGAIVTRLGSTPDQFVGAPSEVSSGRNLVDSSANFPVSDLERTADRGLAGLYVTITVGPGVGQQRLITGNSRKELFLDQPWDIGEGKGGMPDAGSRYLILTTPEFQTDGVAREPIFLRTIDPDVGGSDTIQGGAGRDIVFGGAGDDTLSAIGEGVAADIILGDHGEAIFEIAGNLAEIRTTDPNTGGNDTITSGAGANIIFGGTGSDILTAGGDDSPDILLGDNGFALFVEGIRQAIATSDPEFGGADTIIAGDGSNILLGGSDADIITGGAAGDIILGDNGQALFSSAGVLTIIQTVVSAASNDSGADIIRGGNGGDLVFGGGEGDTILAGGSDSARDIVLGDNGRAEFNALGELGFIETTAPDDGGNDTITTGDGPDVVLAGAADDIVLAGVAGEKVGLNALLALLAEGAYDQFDPGDQASDVVVGDNGFANFTDSGVLTEVYTTNSQSGGADTLSGGDGSDMIVGGSGNDVLLGDGGNDLLLGDNARLLFNSEQIIGLNLPAFNGRISPYHIRGIELLHDELGGSDTLLGGSGNDLLYGQFGNDTFAFVGKNLGSDALVEAGNRNERPNDLQDLLDFSGFEGHVRVNLKQPNRQVIERGTPRGRPELAIKLFDGTAFEGVKGSAFADKIKGNTRNNFIDGGDGDDTIRSGLGDDVLHGGAGKDKIWGGRGADWIDGGDGDDRIYGGRDNDALYGGEGDDKIYGGRGNDHIEGGIGNDLIYGRRGDDTLSGGEGDDLIYGGRGNDHIEGGSGNDLIYGRRGDDALYGGEGNDKIYGGRGNDHIEGGIGNDLIYGRRGDDTLSGGEGDDLIYGGSGKDHIEGGSGNDLIDGGRGDDALYGGEGDDEIYGGSGKDSLYGEDGDDALFDDSGDDLLDGGAGNNILPSWVKSFVTDLAGAGAKGDPNEKIKITLPEKAVEAPDRP